MEPRSPVSRPGRARSTPRRPLGRRHALDAGDDGPNDVLRLLRQLARPLLVPQVDAPSICVAGRDGLEAAVQQGAGNAGLCLPTRSASSTNVRPGGARIDDQVGAGRVHVGRTVRRPARAVP